MRYQAKFLTRSMTVKNGCKSESQSFVFTEVL